MSVKIIDYTMPDLPHLGFPPPFLGLLPVRLPVLYNEGTHFVLWKPSGVLVQADPWYPRLPVLVEAIRYQASQKKPEFQRLDISPEGLWPVSDLDPECSGPVLFSRDREGAEVLRNLHGSRSFQFVYRFLSLGRPASNSFSCDLPLARHRQAPRVVVSSKTGKISRTEFESLERVGAYTDWQARTHYPRRHQLLVHAFESGLPVLGDRLYARSRPLLLSDLKRDYRPRRGEEEERPLLDGPAYFLEALKIGENTRIEGPAPAKWKALTRQLERHSLPGNSVF